MSPESVVSMCSSLFKKDVKGYVLGIRGYEWNFSSDMSTAARNNLLSAYSFLLDIISDFKNLSNSVSYSGDDYQDKKSVLILGIGNIARMDDGIGIHVVNHILESGIKIPGDVEIIEAGMALYDFLPLMMNREKIIIVDALKTDDNPGAIYRFPAENLKSDNPNTIFRFSTIKEILQQVYFTSGKTEVEIIGIVPEDTDSEKILISDSLRKIIHRAAAETLKAAVKNA